MKTRERLPEWLRQTGGKLKATRKLSKVLRDLVPNSICQEAKCPNRYDCFSKGVLTFMILGVTCTRNCGFCSVAHGKPLPPDPNEIEVIWNAIDKLNLRFAVLTSPNRDDLSDGGSAHYAKIVRQIKEKYPSVRVEVLIPDFKGNETDLRTVIESKPDVLNHNVETVPSLYKTVRKGSLYRRSLDLLAKAKEINPSGLTKSGLMVGLGETTDELLATCQDIRDAGVDILTLGQYLRPSGDNLEVEKYYTPEEF
ncbi:MAG: lipoic acid synthetase, partial [Candidatus Marinamargulisbacteria bacterium]